MGAAGVLSRGFWRRQFLLRLHNDNPGHHGRRAHHSQPFPFAAGPRHERLPQQQCGLARGRCHGHYRPQSTATSSSGSGARSGPGSNSSGLAASKALPQPRPAPRRKSLPAPGPPKEDPIPIANNVTTLPLWQRLGPLTWAAENYARAQRRRPYVTQVCTSVFIALCADQSVQRMSVWTAEAEAEAEAEVEKDDVATPAGSAVSTATSTSTTSPPPPTYSYDPMRTARSLVIGAIFAIPTYRWFIFLSRNFNYSSHMLSLTVKVVVNQLCYTPVFNTYFFGMQALLAGETPREALDRVSRTVPISFVNAIKLWPAVTAFSFTFVPMEYRSVFSGVIAVGWQTYLVYLNRTAEMEETARPAGQIPVGPVS